MTLPSLDLSGASEAVFKPQATDAIGLMLKLWDEDRKTPPELRTRALECADRDLAKWRQDMENENGTSNR